MSNRIKKLKGDLLPTVTRVEVIDETGRAYVNWKEGNSVRVSFQDEGRTLKVFISKRDK